MKIHDIMIRTYDIDVALEFYQNVLDLKVISVRDFKEAKIYYLAANEEDVKLALCYNFDHLEKYTHGSHFGYIGYEINSMEEFSCKLKELGMSFYREPFQTEDGNTWAFIKDPDGHAIELVELKK